MHDVIIYTKNWCGYCRAAKQLLSQLDQEYREIDVTSDPEQYREMVKKADGRTTVPQIFVDGEGIGGFTELYQRVQQRGSL